MMIWVLLVSVALGAVVDTDLARETDGRLRGYMNRPACVEYCKAKNSRLPTWDEWKLACQGTQNKDCQPNGARSPLQNFARDIEPSCRGSEMYTFRCMNDPRINKNYLKISDEPPLCLSPKKAKNCVGVLGQWVSNNAADFGGRRANGVFVGGLYAQPKSSDHYITIAHLPEYTDYSIGCRCITD